MKIRKSIAIIICVISLIVSVFLLSWTWDMLTETYREEFLRQAFTISAGFDPVAIRTLQRDSEGNPDYLRLKEQLQFVQVIFPDVEYLYLVNRGEGDETFILMDTESSGFTEELRRELNLDAPIAVLEEVFITGEENIDDVETSDGRRWEKIIIPLLDPYSGETDAVLGLVMDSSGWNNSIKLAYSLPFWSIVIINLSSWGFAAFLGYWQKTRDEQKPEVLGRYYMIVFTGIIGACITIISVWYVSFYERESRQKIFQQLSMEKVNNITVELRDIDRYSLQGLEEFFLGSDFVSQDEFIQYAEPLVENKLVSAWAWVPYITAEERTNFETTLQENTGSFSGVWEHDEEGDEQVAGTREIYFPIEYITPGNTINSELVGFDLDTCEVGGLKLEEALEVGLTVGSVPVPALCGYSGEYILVLRPVWAFEKENSQIGFVAAFIQVEKLLQVTQLDEDLGGSTIYLDFIQYSSEGEPYLLISNSPEEMSSIHLESNLHTHSEVEFTMIEPIFVYGNTYAVVTHPSPDFIDFYPANSGIILAFSGGLLTIALMFFVNDTSGRNVILSRLVRQRTQELSISEERLRLASDSVKLGVYDINTRTWEVIVNDIYAEMLGYNPEEFEETYQAWLNRIHPEDRRKTQKLFERFMKGLVSDYRVEFRLSTAEGRWIWVLSTAMVVERDDKNHPLRILGSHLDITSSKKATEKIVHLLDQSNHRLKQLESLREIDKAITSDYALDRILDVFLYEAKRQMDIDIVVVFIYDAISEVFRYAGSLGLDKVGIRELTVDRNHSLAGRAANLGRPIHTQSYQDLIDPTFLPLLEEEGIKDCFVFSLVTQGKVKGAMEFWHRSVKKPDAEWMNYAEALAGQAAIAVEYSQLFTGLREANEELTSAYDATIEGWSLAMDLKDKETEGHTQRVTELTIELAKRIGIEGEELSHIRRGALLHDIGKMGIPDAILLKPGLLTDEERVTMQEHPRYAYNMLNSIEYLRPALDIPYLHHEKWDGTGYPLGLSGENIPLPARLFALVDVFDALTNDRPYRSAWTVEKTLAYIEENSGIHFDPAITPLFITMIREELNP